MLALGGAAGNFQAGRQYSASLKYTVGNLLISAGVYSGNSGGTVSTPIPKTAEFWGRAIGATYNFDVLKAKAQFVNYKVAQSYDSNVYSAGLDSYVTPQLNLNGGIYFTGDRNHMANHSIMGAAGATYNLSKCTALYAQVAVVNNHGKMNTGITADGALSGVQGTTVVADIGIRISSDRRVSAGWICRGARSRAFEAVIALGHATCAWYTSTSSRLRCHSRMPSSDTSTKRQPAAKRTRGRPSGTAHVGFDSLLRCARQRFAKQGYAATSVREIAALAGVDPALMAHHFGSKEGLWTAVVDQLAAQLAPLIEMTKQLRNSRMSPIERIRQALTLFVDNVFANPDIGMFFSTSTTEHGERLNVLVERLLRPYRDALVPLLEDAIEAGKMKSRDPELMHAMIVNSISTTISYGHVFAKFSTLPEHPEKFKQGVLEIAMGLLR